MVDEYLVLLLDFVARDRCFEGSVEEIKEVDHPGVLHTAFKEVLFEDLALLTSEIQLGELEVYVMLELLGGLLIGACEGV